MISGITIMGSGAVVMAIGSYFSGFLLICASNLVSILGLLVVRRALREKDLISSHDVGGYLLSVVGTMYAVTVGLVVVDSMNQFEEARLMTEQESNCLADMILLSYQLPVQDRQKIQDLTLKYIDEVIKDEWPAMNAGRHSLKARRAAISLIGEVSGFAPKSEKDIVIYDALVDLTCRFWDSRRTRTLAAMQGVPTLEWFVLISGGIITVVFTYFFKLKHLRVQAFMTALVSTTIAINRYLVVLLGYP